MHYFEDSGAEQINAGFEEKTGIAPRVHPMDSIETAETKLLVGGSGYDVTVMGAPNAARLIATGALLPLDHAKIPNLEHVDPDIMAMLAQWDEGNRHVVPYTWGTTGIGYNVDMVNERIENPPVDSLDLIFKPENAEKLADCGIAMTDYVPDLATLALIYLGLDPFSGEAEDLNKAQELLQGVRPYIRYFRLVGYGDDLVNGEICVVLGYNYEVLYAAQTAAESDTGANIAYSVPKEGTNVWYDLLVVPADAPNPDAAHAWINHAHEPGVAAEVTNYVYLASSNLAADRMIDQAVLDNPAVYPPKDVKDRLISERPVPEEVARARQRMVSRFIAGR